MNDEIQRLTAALEVEVEKRRHAETALAAQDREFNDFVENAALGLHQVAADGTILWANRAELDLLGYQEAEYIGRHIADFHVDTPTIDDILCRLTGGETIIDYPARLRCKDGSVKHVLIHSNGRFEEGRLLYTRCFTRDVTDKIAREQILHERNDLLREAPVATAILIGPAFTFELANDLYKNMVGRADLEGKQYLEAFPELAETPLPGILKRVYETGIPFVAEEYPVPLFKKGTLENFFFKFNLQPLRRSSGEIFGMMAVAVDVTELVSAREVQKQNQIEREIILKKLEASDRAKDEFLAILGHELRNPLSPIVTALDLMKRRGNFADVKEYAVIQRQVQHLIRLVDDLLDVSRITRGKVDLRKETVELRDVLSKSVEMVSVLAEQREHTLRINIPTTGLQWHGDPTRLAQVVSNLLSNAVHYTPPGGQITLKAWREENMACIAVADNGKGISPEGISKIFDLFYQVPENGDRSRGGLGIGLALVKNLVKAHGGTVEASSPGIGLGSEFVVRLPLRRDKLQDENSLPVIDATSTASQKIMVIDDNKDAADLLSELLEMNGHITAVAYDPITALNLVKIFKPDTVFTDIGLPVMDGYELALQLRNELSDADSCKIYAVTGFGQTLDKEKTTRAGFAGHFVKPVNAEAILAELSRQGNQ